MPDTPGPIDVLRDEAAAATPPIDTPEYGLNTRSLPVTNKDEAPLTVRLKAAAPAAPVAVEAQDWRELSNEIEDLAGRMAELESEVAQLKDEIAAARKT